MAARTKIEWTRGADGSEGATWNPVTGCIKISQGCKNCYAERMAKRIKEMGAARYADGFKPTLHHDLLDQPRRWRKGRTIFVCSMSDLFQDAVPDLFIEQVFAMMVECPQHTFQVLTKRSTRLREMALRLPWPKHVWAGVSVEDKSATHRIEDIAHVPASVRFLSCEPLLGPLDSLDLAGIGLVIVGGESGPRARRMSPEWVESIRVQCAPAGVPFFFKQWGGTNKKKAGRILNGRTYDEMPTSYRG